MWLLALTAITVGVLLAGHEARAQATRPLPFSAQLRTDPAVGNVQGIQRYGRPLRTDPDQGDGFSYHVYPVAEPAMVMAPTGPSGAGVPDNVRSAISDEIAQIQQASRLLAKAEAQNDPEAVASAQRSIEEARKRLARVFQAGVAAAPIMVSRGVPHSIPHPAPFDWTSGVRNFPIGRGPATPFVGLPPEARAEVLQALGFRRRAVDEEGELLGPDLFEVFHQPLIQIKIRVVEVDRSDELLANSILEYVSVAGSKNSLTSGDPLNNMMENFKGITNFGIEGLISGMDMGAGGLVNLTTEHINWVAAVLATEFNADVITAPEMVTLNGQNVEFLAGEKIPFQLGQNVIQGTNNNIQQVFYKHVGTMVSVTPTIVNWGFHGEGQGESSVVAQEIPDWNTLVDWMIEQKIAGTALTVGNITYNLNQYRTGGLVLPFQLKSELLMVLNEYTRSDLVERGLPLGPPFGPPGCNDWKPEDCTIDLTVVVRLSNAGIASVDLGLGEEPVLEAVTAEKNVRAVANVIQVKSGHGVVMAGLIGERELEQATKVPVIGDLPVVGSLFRAKSTARAKTEVLIFIEAKVLDPDPAVARAESSYDFLLGQGYVDGEFLDNPLELGMHRVGFGSYLPPTHPSEQIYWQRFGRRLRKISTHIDDTLE